MSQGWDRLGTARLQYWPGMTGVGQEHARLQHLMENAKTGVEYAELSQSNQWHVQDLWLEAGLVGEPNEHPRWVAVHTAELES